MLEHQSAGLALRALDHPDFSPLIVDWTDAEMRRRIAGGRRQLLARAIGLHKQADLHVLDATAGLGRDGFVLAALGAQVTMVERKPPLIALLRDVLHRTAQQADWQSAAQRVELIEGEACDVIRGDTVWDVIHLDPMYPQTGKRALPQKDMQILRALTDGDLDNAPALLLPALSKVRRRVVVKRPRTAPWLSDRKPDFQLTGSQTRYDIYLPLSPERNAAA